MLLLTLLFTLVPILTLANPSTNSIFSITNNHLEISLDTAYLNFTTCSTPNQFLLHLTTGTWSGIDTSDIYGSTTDTLTIEASSTILSIIITSSNPTTINISPFTSSFTPFFRPIIINTPDISNLVTLEGGVYTAPLEITTAQVIIKSSISSNSNITILADNRLATSHITDSNEWVGGGVYVKANVTTTETLSITGTGAFYTSNNSPYCSGIHILSQTTIFGDKSTILIGTAGGSPNVQPYGFYTNYGLLFRRNVIIGSPSPSSPTILHGTSSHQGPESGGVWFEFNLDSSTPSLIQGSSLDITGHYLGNATSYNYGVYIGDFTHLTTNGDGYGNPTNDPNSHIYITGTVNSGPHSYDTCGSRGVTFNFDTSIIHLSSQPGLSSAIIISGSAGACEQSEAVGVYLNAPLTCQGCDVYITGTADAIYANNGQYPKAVSITASITIGGSLSIIGKLNDTTNDITSAVFMASSTHVIQGDVYIYGQGSLNPTASNCHGITLLQNLELHSHGKITLEATSLPSTVSAIAIFNAQPLTITAQDNITILGNLGLHSDSSDPSYAYLTLQSSHGYIDIQNQVNSVSGFTKGNDYPAGLILQSNLTTGIIFRDTIGFGSLEISYMNLQPYDPSPIYFLTDEIHTTDDMLFGGPVFLNPFSLVTFKTLNGNITFVKDVEWSFGLNLTNSLNLVSPGNITIQQNLFMNGLMPDVITFNGYWCVFDNPLTIVARAREIDAECINILEHGGLQAQNLHSDNTMQIYLYPTAGSVQNAVQVCGQYRCNIFFDSGMYSSGLVTTSKMTLWTYGNVPGNAIFDGDLVMIDETEIIVRIDNTDPTLPHDDWMTTSSHSFYLGYSSILPIYTDYSATPASNVPMIVMESTTIHDMFIQGYHTDPINDISFNITYNPNSNVILNYIQPTSSSTTTTTITTTTTTSTISPLCTQTIFDSMPSTLGQRGFTQGYGFATSFGVNSTIQVNSLQLKASCTDVTSHILISFYTAGNPSRRTASIVPFNKIYTIHNGSCQDLGLTDSMSTINVPISFTLTGPASYFIGMEGISVNGFVNVSTAPFATFGGEYGSQSHSFNGQKQSPTFWYWNAPSTTNLIQFKLQVDYPCTTTTSTTTTSLSTTTTTSLSTTTTTSQSTTTSTTSPLCQNAYYDSLSSQMISQTGLGQSYGYATSFGVNSTSSINYLKLKGWCSDVSSWIRLSFYSAGNPSKRTNSIAPINILYTIYNGTCENVGLSTSASVISVPISHSLQGPATYFLVIQTLSANFLQMALFTTTYNPVIGGEYGGTSSRGLTGEFSNNFWSWLPNDRILQYSLGMTHACTTTTSTSTTTSSTTSQSTSSTTTLSTTSSTTLSTTTLSTTSSTTTSPICQDTFFDSLSDYLEDESIGPNVAHATSFGLNMTTSINHLELSAYCNNPANSISINFYTAVAPSAKRSNTLIPGEKIYTIYNGTCTNIGLTNTLSTILIPIYYTLTGPATYFLSVNGEIITAYVMVATANSTHIGGEYGGNPSETYIGDRAQYGYHWITSPFFHHLQFKLATDHPCTTTTSSTTTLSTTTESTTSSSTTLSTESTKSTTSSESSTTTSSSETTSSSSSTESTSSSSTTTSQSTKSTKSTESTKSTQSTTQSTKSTETTSSKTTSTSTETTSSFTESTKTTSTSTESTQTTSSSTESTQTTSSSTESTKTTSSSTESTKTTSSSTETSSLLQSTIISTTKPFTFTIPTNIDFTVVPTHNGAFATSIPQSAFSNAISPTATQHVTMTIFTEETLATTLTSAGSIITITKTILVPTAVETQVVDARVTYMASMTRIPVIVTTTNIPQATPIEFVNLIDSTMTFAGARIMSAIIYEKDTGNSWQLISNGDTIQPMANNIKWRVKVATNGYRIAEVFDFQPNIGPDKLTAMLYPGQVNAEFYISIVTRLYRLTMPSSRIEFTGLIEYADSNSLGKFEAKIIYPVSSSTTRKTTSTKKSTTRKTSTKSTTIHRTTTTKTTTRTTTSSWPTNWQIAESCYPGGHYNNVKNCCCKPPSIVHRTRTITVTPGYKITSSPKSFDYRQELLNRQVSGEHLCVACPIKVNPVNVKAKLICCLPPSTKTIYVKTIYKTRTI